MTDVANRDSSSNRSLLVVVFVLLVVVAATTADRFLDTRRPDDTVTVGRAMAATVVVEKRIVWREKGTLRYLHAEGTEGPRLREITNEDELLSGPTTQAGSGLCFSPAGWIVTAAGALAVPDPKKVGEWDVVPEAIVDVIFAWHTQRFRAKVIWAGREGRDPALLKIESLGAASFLVATDAGMDSPRSGDSVRLFGVPRRKGLYPSHERRRVSMVDGRVVDAAGSSIQVEATLFSGVVGGPIIDDTGRPIGILGPAVKKSGSRADTDVGLVLPIGDVVGRMEKQRQPETQRLEGARAATVSVEKRIVWRERGTDRYLHAEGTEGPRLREITNEDELRVERQPPSVGFCASSSGWIVTSAEVATLPGPLRIKEWTLVPEAIVDVAFSGTSVRRRAGVSLTAGEPDDQLALVKIMPFAGLPILEPLQGDVVPPREGDWVRLLGFPPGAILPGANEAVAASAVVGAIGRSVGTSWRVEATAYPGGCGGPVIDRHGRVIGIVESVPKTPGVAIAPIRVHPMRNLREWIAAQRRLAGPRLECARAATVYVEKRIVWRDQASKRYLHAEGTQGPRLREITNEAELRFERKPGGAGFCITPSGRIVTNAEVATLPDPLKISQWTLVPEVIVDVVFSGTSVRRRARIVPAGGKWRDRLALLEIEPFVGMAVLEALGGDTISPRQGDRVRLLGFPRRRATLRANEVIAADVMVGTVGPRVDGHLRVQSALYPGGSGGPVLDRNGRVIGVVASVPVAAPGKEDVADARLVPIGNLAEALPDLERK